MVFAELHLRQMELINHVVSSNLLRMTASVHCLSLVWFAQQLFVLG